MLKVAPGDAIYPAGANRHNQLHSAGTLGLAVMGEQGESLALTAAHVVGSLSGAHGQEPIEVLLTKNFTQGAGDPRLGVVSASHPSEPCGLVDIDASLIRLDRNVEAGAVVRESPTSSCPFDLDDLDDLLVVHKRGMNTPHLTSGLLEPGAVGLKVDHPGNDGQILEYTRGFYVHGGDPGVPFAKPGDSGSIVVDNDDCVVGMVVALITNNPQDPGPDDPAFVVAITDILDTLGIQLPGPKRACTER